MDINVKEIQEVQIVEKEVDDVNDYEINKEPYSYDYISKDINVDENNMELIDQVFNVQRMEIFNFRIKEKDNEKIVD